MPQCAPNLDETKSIHSNAGARLLHMSFVQGVCHANHRVSKRCANSKLGRVKSWSLTKSLTNSRPNEQFDLQNKSLNCQLSEKMWTKYKNITLKHVNLHVLHSIILHPLDELSCHTSASPQTQVPNVSNWYERPNEWEIMRHIWSHNC